MTALHRLAALVVVRNVNGEVLLVRSARRPERWELPGGQVEAGESPMDAAVREVLEETGFAITSLTPVGLYYGTGDNLLRVAFAANSIESPVRPADPRFADEILELEWFPPDELPHPMPKLARGMVRAAVDGQVELLTVVDDSDVS